MRQERRHHYRFAGEGPFEQVYPPQRDHAGHADIGVAHGGQGSGVRCNDRKTDLAVPVRFVAEIVSQHAEYSGLGQILPLGIVFKLVYDQTDEYRITGDFIDLVFADFNPQGQCFLGGIQYGLQRFPGLVAGVLFDPVKGHKSHDDHQDDQGTGQRQDHPGSMGQTPLQWVGES